MRRFATAAALYLTVLAVAAVVAGVFRPDGATSPVLPQGSTGLEPEDIELVAALEPFGGCEDLLAYFKREGLERVGPYGLGGSPYMRFSVDAMAGAESVGGAAGAVSDRAADTTAGAVTAEQAGGDQGSFSGTNVQEAGVDEPDTVKTDGEIVVTLAGERLQILGVDGDGLRRLSSLRIPNAWGNELLLDGDRVLVLGHGQGDVMPMDVGVGTVESDMIAPHMGAPISTLRLVDISDLTAPEVVSTVTLDGDYVSARLAEGVARIVLRSQPAALPFVMPEGGGLRAERRATARNREVIEESTIDQWLPYAVVSDERAGIETESTLLDCDTVHHPETFSGFGMVSVLSVDLSEDLRTDGAAGVVGSAETVYASPDNLYVALNDWGMDWSAERAPAPPRTAAPATDIHQFDISDPSAARYVASGRVRGRMLNQWAMSEHEGHLRVATTIDSMDGAQPSESAVVILRDEDGTLKPQGRVGGLGKTEQIYAVRYDGDIGYVVTFRQTDPLYTLDLSNPKRPRTKGELKVNGYSAYLHPVAEGRVLGIGQDAKDDGQIIGSQASLFDVSDLTDPRRVDQVGLGSGQSTVEHDHRAFLFWEPTGMVVVPLQTWERKPFAGAVVLRVDADSVRRVGRISHAKAARAERGGGGQATEPRYGFEGPMITRSLVLDDALLTVSEAGILVSDLDDLSARDWVAFTR